MKTNHVSQWAEIVLDVVQTEPGPTMDQVAICGQTAQHEYKTRCGIPTMWVKEHVGHISCAACPQCSVEGQVVPMSTGKAIRSGDCVIQEHQ